MVRQTKFGVPQKGNNMKRLALGTCLFALTSLLTSQVMAIEFELARHIASKNKKLHVGQNQIYDLGYVEEETISTAVIESDSSLEAAVIDASYSAGVDVAGELCGAGKCSNGSDCLCESCCHQGGWTAGVEMTWFRYHRADGNRVGVVSGANDDDAVEFDFKQAPRVTLGYVSPDGMGVRARWWQFDQKQGANDVSKGSLGVDTYNIDIEIFEEIDLTPCASVELFAGMRYNDFDENFVGDNATRILNVNSSTYGGVFGTQVNRIIQRGKLFARVRGAILMDDANVLNASDVVVRTDMIQGMTEFATGFEVVQCTPYGSIRFMLGAEWQHWFNYSTEFDTTTSGGPTDVGFGGITTGFSFDY